LGLDLQEADSRNSDRTEKRGRWPPKRERSFVSVTQCDVQNNGKFAAGML